MALALSILICTTSARSEIIKPLLESLEFQLKYLPANTVEILINDHETDTVGKKRNDLINLAKGEWQTAIDSDDEVSLDYLTKILEALKSNPDCVGISGIITTNGQNPTQWHISKDYKKWHVIEGVYVRTPNHISPIRTSIARQVGFKDISWGEDADFSERVLPLLKSEVKVIGDIYHYKFNTNKTI